MLPVSWKGGHRDAVARQSSAPEGGDTDVSSCPSPWRRMISPNKVDELVVLTWPRRKYREDSIMLFTGRWLTTLIPGAAATLADFQLG